jgi:hypothetical protein
MKFQLKKITLAQYPAVSLDYRAELLRICQIAEEGVTATELPVYLGLATRLQGAEAEIVLSAEEHGLLLQRLLRQRWNLIVPEILDFLREFSEAGHGSDNE